MEQVKEEEALTPTEFIDQLRQVRENKGLLQRDVADKTGISRDAVHRLESHRTQNPTITTVLNIAHALGVKVELRIRKEQS